MVNDRRTSGFRVIGKARKPILTLSDSMLGPILGIHTIGNAVVQIRQSRMNRDGCSEWGLSLSQNSDNHIIAEATDVVRHANPRVLGLEAGWCRSP